MEKNVKRFEVRSVKTDGRESFFVFDVVEHNSYTASHDDDKYTAAWIARILNGAFRKGMEFQRQEMNQRAEELMKKFGI